MEVARGNAMPLSWNEIKDRALKFSREWADEASEDAEAKSFWDGYFNALGVSRRRVGFSFAGCRRFGGSFRYSRGRWASPKLTAGRED
jgi:hypothetical protein